MSTPKPVVLCILDGWGLRQDTTANAPALGHTPTFDRIMSECPHATLVTHGRDVGLPTEQMGNSEVGHTNIGAGRIVAMDLGQIDLAIEDGSYGSMPALQNFITTLKSSGGTAHLMGVVSDGGVHAHIDHLIETANILDAAGIPIVVHAITDGRDVAQKSALKYFELLDQKLPKNAVIGTVIGRYFALDRDNRWDRVAQAYHAMANGTGPTAATPAEVITAAYADDKTDEFIPPSVIGDYAGMKDGDGIFMLNYRADRAREILAALGDPAFDAFDVSGRPALAAKLGMVDYSTAHDDYMTTVFPKQKIKNTLGEWVAKQGLRNRRTELSFASMGLASGCTARSYTTPAFESTYWCSPTLIVPSRIDTR